MENADQIICPSCGFEHSEKFCPNCGEKGKIRRITLRSVATEAFSTLINMDKGFLYNLKELTLNPKKLVTDYLKGKRKNIFNPISYLIIAISLYVILTSFFSFDYVSRVSTGMEDSTLRKIGVEAGKILAEYIKFFWVISVLFLSMPSAFLYNKQNFAEHIAISAFIIGHSTFFITLLLPIYNVPIIFHWVLYALIAVMYYRIYKTDSRIIESITLSFISVVVFFIQLFLFTIFLGVISYFLFS